MRGGLVSRPRLVERLTQGLRGPLTLISAPAGSGKTTLLSAWRAGVGSDFPAAWLSLDAGDNDPARFLTYLAAALETLQKGFTEDTHLLLRSPQPEPVEYILTSLINDILSFPGDFALILDDYHTLTSPLVHEAVRFILDHQPAQMHLVILTRADPPLPLPRMRVRSQLVEIRAADLRFTQEEAAAFLNEVMGLGLSAADIAALEQRIEGWVAGFQLAAVALQSRLAEQGRENVHSFVSAFTGSHHYIVEYLAEEVLNQQPEAVGDFLLQTSILERFNAELCEAVLGDRGKGIGDISSPALILEYLDKANLFLIPLDDARTWFRYHPLFADVLRGRLQQTQPGLLPVMHRRAAGWYEQHGLDGEAFGHALAAGDKSFAVDLVERKGWSYLMRGEWITVANWIRALDDCIWQRPGLGLIQAWTLTLTGQGNVEDRQLLKIEQSISDDPGLDAAAKSDLFGRIATLRGLLTYYRGDAQGAVELCRQALASLNEDNFIGRSIAAHILGESCNRCGDLEGAIQANLEAARLAKATGSLSLAISATTALGDLQIGQGNLHGAFEVYQEALRFVTRPDGKRLLPAGRVFVCLSKIYYEWNDLPAAGKSIQDCIELCQQSGDLEYLIIGYVMKARLEQAQGDLEGASRAMQEAVKLMKEHRVPATTISLVEAFRVRLLLVQDRPAALRWAEQSGLKTTHEISFIRELEYRSLARVAAAQGETAQALSLLRRLTGSAESAGRMGWVIHLLALQAVILYGSGNFEEAEEALERVLRLAQPEDYRRVFLDEGEPMAKLLIRIKEASRKKGQDPRLVVYLDQILAELGIDEQAGVHPGRLSVGVQAGLVEPLSDRELEVLGLLAAGKTNQQIANELYLAVGTVKRHLNNIFGKLDVQNRTQCVAKAREIRLI